jgi:uncharacterized protein YkwD
VAFALLVAGPAPAHAACVDEDLPVSSGEVARLRTAAVCVINAERAARGVRPLVREQHLDVAAQSHSEDMVRRDYFEHDTLPGPGSPEGAQSGDFCTRMRFYGYRSCDGVAEGLDGADTALGAVASQMSDVPHCEPILQGSRGEIGVGIAGSGWTFDFGEQDFPETSALCPDALVKDGGSTDQATEIGGTSTSTSGSSSGSVKAAFPRVDRAVVGKSAVTIPVTCPTGGRPCVVTATLKTASRREAAVTITLRPGASKRAVVRLSKAGLKTLRRKRWLRARVRLTMKGSAGVLADRSVTFTA